MIEPQFFYTKLLQQGTDFFTGVPDSLLKSFCAYITDHTPEHNHIIAVNEGAAIALASGYHLATGKIPLVYMQNSGIGNAINPLLSLADPDVYRIPVLLVIGWRGEPGVHDEPQHLKQGKVTCALLEAMGIPFVIMSDSTAELEKQITEGYAYSTEKNAPFAFVVRKDTFAAYTLRKNTELAGNHDRMELEMSREEAIEEIICSSDRDAVFFSTTGMASRELYELRETHGMGHEQDFLTVGSMGHASQIALAVALQNPRRSVTCLDGDGALLMHTGALGTIGVRKPGKYRHIVLNNGAHDSVGGQPTIAFQIDLCALARACGYRNVYAVHTKAQLHSVLSQAQDGTTFIEVCIHKGARNDLGRPCSTPEENKKAFMLFLSNL
ncbi:MAG: phosphonopyruvate decarboxylase [Treponema sp.]|jgi:phosphonopyruvate decarboxylase|nr:phosphonopyruvate decarboxylase [Treponema sp.]